jgi:orotate phosphoribosyltransferase
VSATFTTNEVGNDPIALAMLERLRRVGALLEGHFELSSGRHSNRYIQCAQLMMHPAEAEVACRDLAGKLADVRADLVVGPAMGGIIVAYELARHLKVPALFAERKDGAMTLRRGFAIEPGQRVIVVEDVVTTGGSAKEVIDLLREAGAEVAAVASLVCRAEESPFEQRFETLLMVKVDSWDPSDPPEWAKGSTPVKPGSRPKA